MPPIIHMIAMLPAWAASCLISAIWQGMVLAIGVTLCLHFLPETTAAIRSMIWSAAFVLVIALHIAATITNSPSIQHVSHGPAIHLDFRWGVAIAALWILLLLVRGLQLAMSAMRLRRIANNAAPFEAGQVFKDLLNRAHRSVELCTSTDVDSPSVIGFISPRILIPAALLEKLSPSQLEQIVLHEMEHLRRGDDWINLLQKVSLVLFPLNPVLHWIERRLCIERELACDESVLRFTQAPKAYATCLVELAEHSMLQARTPLALRAWERQSELSSRVRRILRQSNVSLGHGSAKLVAGSLVLGLLGGAASLSHCPQIVSFASSPVSLNTLAESHTETSPSLQDAAFHFGVAHPTLIKDVVTKRHPVQAVPLKLRQRQSKVRRRDHRRRMVSSLLLVADWNGRGVPSGLCLAVVEDFRPSVDSAAHPAAGWVVFQL
jgi:beta-lactamase regulating signal transducer with metallopeptidase domain